MAGQTQASVQILQQQPLFRLNTPDLSARNSEVSAAFGQDRNVGRHRGKASLQLPRQYALPLRSLPYGDATGSGTTQYSPRAELFLRRKTPSGTLTSAYDATSGNPSSKTHAAKHIILPAGNAATERADGPQTAASTAYRNVRLGHVQPQPQDMAPGFMDPFSAVPSTGRFQQTTPGSFSSRQPAMFNFPLPQAQSFYPQAGQAVPNVVQPPSHTPLAHYHPAGLSDLQYGLYGMASNGWAGYWDPNYFEPAIGAINQNIHGLSLNETGFRQSPHQDLHWNSMRRDLTASNGASGMHPNASLQQYHSSLNSVLSAERPLNQPFDASNVTPTRLAPPLGQAIHPSGHHPVLMTDAPTNPFLNTHAFPPQDILSRAHTLYVALVQSIQQTRRIANHGDISSTKQLAPHLQVYPEPVKRPMANSLSHDSISSDRPYRSQYENNSNQNCSYPGQHGSQDSQPYAAPPFDLNPPPLQNSEAYPRVEQPLGYSGIPNRSFSMHERQRVRQSVSGHSFPFISPGFCGKADLKVDAWNVLEALGNYCTKSNLTWTEGMLVAGCLAYVLEDYQRASFWFSTIRELDDSHVEATSNLAATFLACNRRQEAEQHWRLALKIQPGYFEAAEHLVGLLCYDHRHQEAVQIIEHIQRSLQLQNGNFMQGHPSYVTSQSREAKTIPTSAIPPFHRGTGSPDRAQEQDGGKFRVGLPQPATFNRKWQPYSIADADVGRLVTLIHAKGNILYSLQDHVGAANAFEEVVLIATGIRNGGLKDLIEFIIARLSDPSTHAAANSREPLLLLPDRALQTAKLCFGPMGDLPGLGQVTNKMARKAAVSVTSNSLLSLAKIFQDAMSSNADVPLKPKVGSGVRDILALYYLSLSLHPSPSTANNVGILLASVQQTMPVKKVTSSGRAETFMFPGVVPGSGTALALTYYQYGLGLDSKHAHLFTNLGSLLKDVGQLSLAIKMYEKAVSCDGNFDIALANLANAVKDQGKTGEAIGYYKRAVQVNPSFAEAVCGLANALNSICDWTGRGGVIMTNRNLDRWHVDDHRTLVDARNFDCKGSGWVQRVVEIVESQLTAGEGWGLGVLQSSRFDLIVEQVLSSERNRESKMSATRRLLESWSGQKWEGSRAVRLVERLIRWVGWRWYHDKYTRRKERPLAAYNRPQLPASLSSPGAPTVLPFHTFTFPVTAKQIRLISQRNALRVSCSSLRAPWLPRTVYPPPPPPAPCLNVAYVSSDFNNHPLAHLMQSVFGMHDVDRVKAFCYATTASDSSVHRQQIESEAPVFYDASSWPVERLVNQINLDGIHILVNLNGYTRGARNEIFAARPAPIQMSFMGFAGTLGAEWCDYLLADETAIPPQTLRPYRGNVTLEDLAQDKNSGDGDENWVYGENVIYARDTFFCCDHRQSASSSKERRISWNEEQKRRWKMRKELFPNIDDDTIIFGNFNQLYKIDPTTFRTWLRILSRLRNSILWLLRFPDLGEQHLRDTAISWASPEVASRIYFTDVAPKATHIARACVADLFLDTPECNAHTTAADCLWSGTPLLTLPRYEWKMCSRMAASILGGALPLHTEEGRRAWHELVVSSEEEYENRAVSFGKGLRYHRSGTKTEYGEVVHRVAHGRLADLRKMIWHHRWECKLFDTKRWVRDLEAGYEEAWRRWISGKGGDIWLKDLL